MALFGKKKAADAAAPANATTEGAIPPAADDGTPAAPVAAKARTTKAPKAPKSNTSKSGTVVGLNIGNAYIKAVEVTSKGGQLAVTGMGVIATPPESYQNGNVLSITALSNAIRTMWKQAGLSSKATVFSVAGTGSLVVRVIEVPKMTDGELVDNMRVDADRYIPFPPSEVVMDFKALRDLPSDPDAANMEVLLAAAQREIIDLHVSVIQKAKLTPRAIDVEPLALARTMQLDLRAQNPIIDYDDVTAVLNIGLTGTEISILRGDIVVFTRSIPNGSGNLTSAIAETMGIPTSDAERLKIERGDALPPAGYGDGAEEDFGFGDFDAGDGGQTVDFSDGGFDDDFGGDTAIATTTTTATATDDDAAPATSDDPFDLDFFDQGPQQAEPGAGHGQKEDDEDEAPAGISFSFDKLDDDLTPTRNDEVTPASPPPPVTGNADAPSMEDFDLPDTYLPATSASNAPTPAATPAPATPAPATPAPATPAPATPAPATPAMPSAFDFSDFDLPTMEEVPAKSAAAPAPTQKLSAEPAAPAPVAAPAPTVPTPSVAPAPAAVSFGFSDDKTASDDVADATEDVVVAPTSSLNFEKSAEPDADTMPVSLDKSDDVATMEESVDEDGFDLDDVFGTPTQSAEAEAVPVAVGAVGADATTMDADDGGFDVGGFGQSAVGDFDAGETDDFSTFGTGLSQTGETDDITLYTAMQPVLDDLATEVRRSLEFHLGRYPDTTFSRLVLVGGGAKLRNLDEFLAGNLGVPTSVGDPFAHIKVNAPGLPSEFAPTNAPLCAVALGLALRDFVE